ncbi:Transcription factor TGAL1 [Zea mays]|uniref:Transcription factor TGAL1 n=1 Tax=Zea mays TaxID=4577 RepID=A0A3L6DJV5_MAIZE|nr:hypothetical protein Zm00014a_036918 [Zea mays]PWZ08881.1 hypothetical protein Zm00014a_036918 [Zea mays]PWZ08882.1 Transcription factor TGAL1 [Zea mays]
MAYASPGTDDTSTDLDTDEKNHMLELGQLVSLTASDSGNKAKDKLLGQKALRRLAQNREAARKSRLRKKAYVEQLEISRLKLSQLEQELQRARQQGIFIPTPGDDQQPNSTSEKAGALAFDKDYAGWEDEHRKQISELRAALSAHAGDDELRRIVDGVMAHHHEAFRLKCVAARADAFHVLSGMWKTPVERCFMWLGGFRPSEILKFLASHLDPLTERQLASVHGLQQSSQQAEEGISQRVQALQQSVAETLASSGSPCLPVPAGRAPPPGDDAAPDCSGTMAAAVAKLGALESLVHEADGLRRQTLEQMQRVLTTRQSARALLVISDYLSRLRALSSLWIARPRE